MSASIRPTVRTRPRRSRRRRAAHRSAGCGPRRRRPGTARCAVPVQLGDRRQARGRRRRGTTEVRQPAGDVPTVARDAGAGGASQVGDQRPPIAAGGGEGRSHAQRRCVAAWARWRGAGSTRGGTAPSGWRAARCGSAGRTGPRVLARPTAASNAARSASVSSLFRLAGLDQHPQQHLGGQSLGHLGRVAELGRGREETLTSRAERAARNLAHQTLAACARTGSRSRAAARRATSRS